MARQQAGGLKRDHVQKTRGLVSNISSDLVPGDLSCAANAMIRKQGLIEPRRSYAELSAQGTPKLGARPIGLMTLNGNVMAMTGDGSISSTTATLTNSAGWSLLATSSDYLPRQGAASVPSVDRLAFKEVNGALFFSSATGVRKYDGSTALFSKAGAPRALDVVLTGVATVSGFLAHLTACAYRVAWGYVDANNTLILGWPSGNVAIYNTSGAAQTVTLKAFIPNEIKTNANAGVWNLYAYRTDITTVGAGLSTIPQPGDQCRLIYQTSFTATDVSNGYVQFTDIYPEGVNKGPELYTNPNQGNVVSGTAGIFGANAQPPLCSDMELYRDVMFFGNTASKHRETVQFLGIPTQWAIGSIAANTPPGQSTYTLAAGSDVTGVATAGAKLAVTGTTGASNDGTWTVVSVNVGSRLVVVANAGVAQLVAAGTAMCGLIKVGGQSYNAAYAAESVGSRLYSVPTDGSGQQNIARMTASLVRIIEQDSGQTACYGYNISGPDDPAGMVQFEEQGIGASAFTFQAFGLDFGVNKCLPAAYYAALSSVNDSSVARVYYSKTGQPEHVPVGNYFDIGQKNKKVLRVVANRDSVFFFKEDGLFRLNGNPNLGATPARFDDTIILTQPNLITLLRNQVCAWSTRGIVSVSDAGVSSIGQPVANLTSALNDISFDTSLFSQAFCSAASSERDGMLYFYAHGFYLDYDGDTNRIQWLELAYSDATKCWTGATQKISTIAGELTTLGWQPAVSVGDVIFRFLPLTNGSVYRELPIAYGDPIVVSVTPPGLTGTTSLDRPISVAANLAPPGEYYSMGISSAASDPVWTFVMPGGARSSPAVGDLVKFVFSESNAYWQITDVSGINITVTPYYMDDTNIGTAPSDGSAVYLVKPFTMAVEYQSYTAGSDTSLKEFSSVVIELDQNSTAQTITLGFSNEENIRSDLNQVTVGPLSTRLVRANVPTALARCRKLGVSITCSEPARYANISGITYIYRDYVDPASLE